MENCSNPIVDTLNISLLYVEYILFTKWLAVCVIIADSLLFPTPW